jgi:hypothetical protein
VAVARVERSQATVVAADEDQAAVGRDRTAVALVDPLLSPGDAVGREIDRPEDVTARRGRTRRETAATDMGWPLSLLAPGAGL